MQSSQLTSSPYTPAGIIDSDSPWSKPDDTRKRVFCVECHTFCVDDPDYGWERIEKDGSESSCDEYAGDGPTGFLCSAECRSAAMYKAATPAQQQALKSLILTLEPAIEALESGLGVRTELDATPSFFFRWLPDWYRFTDVLRELKSASEMLSPAGSEVEWVGAAMDASVDVNGGAR